MSASRTAGVSLPYTSSVSLTTSAENLLRIELKGGVGVAQPSNNLHVLPLACKLRVVCFGVVLEVDCAALLVGIKKFTQPIQHRAVSRFAGQRYIGG